RRRATAAFRIGADVSGAKQPPGKILRAADLPVAVASLGDVLEVGMSVMGVHTPTVAEVIVCREVEIGRPLGALAGGTLDGEVIVGRVEVLRRQELPAAADVELLVVDLRIGAGIRVVN